MSYHDRRVKWCHHDKTVGNRISEAQKILENIYDEVMDTVREPFKEQVILLQTLLNGTQPGRMSLKLTEELVRFQRNAPKKGVCV
jgi:hypothetical protein